MDTRQVNRLAHHDRKISKIFEGVFPCDYLPQNKVLTKSLFIVNKDTHDHPGSHWVSIFIDPHEDQCTYFDSYGLMPYNAHIEKFLRRNCTGYEYNKTVLQLPCSNVCAAYCLFFCYHTARGASLRNITKHFDTRKKRQNDLKVAKFVRTVFKHSFAQVRTDNLCYGQQL